MEMKRKFENAMTSLKRHDEDVAIDQHHDDEQEKTSDLAVEGNHDYAVITDSAKPIAM